MSPNACGEDARMKYVDKACSLYVVVTIGAFIGVVISSLLDFLFAHEAAALLFLLGVVMTSAYLRGLVVLTKEAAERSH